MSTYTPTNVVGTDGANPLVDENARWNVWGIDDIYLGQNGQNRFVPKIKDYVRKPETFQTWIVEAIHPVSLIPTLREIRPYGTGVSLDESDILFGVGPGPQAQLMRVYLNTSVYPYKLTVDSHCMIGGTMNAYVKLFKGGDPSLGGEVISKTYDNSGNFLTENVPLELVAMDSHSNHAIKIVQSCSCTHQLPDGEVITVVFYSADGTMQSKAQLLLENTNYIRGLNIDRKYVSSISLKSPWLTEADGNTLKFPLNIPVNALGLIGQVNYTDGTTMELPVDGNKFTLMGIDGYLSSIVGEKQSLVLHYQLAANELSFAGQGVFDSHVVTEPYFLVTDNVQAGYTVKLFVYPVWDAVMQGYRLRWWLLNLSRNSFVEVTSYVTFDATSTGFDPQGFGYVQRKQVSINLRKVSSSYKPMIHTQVVEITLFGSPYDQVTPWLVLNQFAPGIPAYGRDIHADKINYNTVNLKSGRATLDVWLEDLYSLTYPLVDRRSEVRPQTPSHFEISMDAVNWTDYQIAHWDHNLSLTGALTVDKNIYVRFLRRGITDEILALSALTIRV